MPLITGPDTTFVNALTQMMPQQGPTPFQSYLVGQTALEQRKRNALQQQLQAVQTQALLGRLGLDAQGAQAEQQQRAMMARELEDQLGPGMGAFASNPSAAVSIYNARNPAPRDPLVTVDMGNPESVAAAAQKEELKQRYKFAGETNKALVEQGRMAADNLQPLTHALRLLETGAAETGFGTPAYRALLGAAVRLNLGNEADLANLESLAPVFGQTLFSAISNTKGAVSDKEMGIFQTLGPNYTNSTAGNIKLLRYAKAKAERDRKIGREVMRLQQNPMTSALEIGQRVDEMMNSMDLTESLFDRSGTVRGQRVGYINLPSGGAATFELRDGGIRFIGNVPGAQ